MTPLIIFDEPLIKSLTLTKQQLIRSYQLLFFVCFSASGEFVTLPGWMTFLPERFFFHLSELFLRLSGFPSHPNESLLHPSNSSFHLSELFLRLSSFSSHPSNSLLHPSSSPLYLSESSLSPSSFPLQLSNSSH